MCTLLKLDYSKFSVLACLFSKVIEEKPLGGWLDPPPLVKEGLKKIKWSGFAASHIDWDDGEVKFSLKGVHKGQFKSPMTHYEHALTTKQNFWACNSGIRSKDQEMSTYKQYKNALTYFYLKRKVLEDGHTTVPLDT